jgi:hypothetical protein
MKKLEPEIRAVEMVRSIREAHYEQVKGLSPQEKIEFFREKARRLHSELGKPEELLVERRPGVRPGDKPQPSGTIE